MKAETEEIATIEGNDGEIITIGIRPIKDEDSGQDGYEIFASNGDDIAAAHPQSREKCLQDIEASWGHGPWNLNWLI